MSATWTTFSTLLHYVQQKSPFTKWFEIKITTKENIFRRKKMLFSPGSMLKTNGFKLSRRRTCQYSCFINKFRSTARLQLISMDRSFENGNKTLGKAAEHERNERWGGDIPTAVGLKIG